MSALLHLRLHVDPGAGFCFGVVYAVTLAEEVLAERGHLYCLGDIVHNDEEVQRLRRLGLRIINHAQLAELRDEVVLLRAHGEPPGTYQVALANNLTLLDASCPVIIKLHQRVKASLDQGDAVVIYGQADHAEVRGLLGQTGSRAIVLPHAQAPPPPGLPARLTLYSQTTKSPADFGCLRQTLEAHGHRVRAHDTSCRQVSQRDQQLRHFASQFDQVVFVAGAKSSNGQLLYQACREVNPCTHFVSHPGDLTREWFRPGQTVGICGATSTPHWLLEAVQQELASY